MVAQFRGHIHRTAVCTAALQQSLEGLTFSVLLNMDRPFSLQQTFLCLVPGLTGADQSYHLVKIILGGQLTFNQMGMVTCLSQIKGVATGNHLFAVFNETVKAFAQSQSLRTALDDCNHINREA